MRPRKLVTVALAAGLASGGCVVGPDYRTPHVRVPVAFDTGPSSAPTTQPTQPSTRPYESAPQISRWWESLHDPELNSLIERGIAANLDLKIALMRLQEARAQEYTVAGGAMPLVDFSAGAARGTGSDSTRSRVGAPLHSAANTKGYKEITEVAGFDAAWEVDLFGRFARQIEASKADMQAMYEARNAVLITIAADIARAYVDVRDLQLRLDVAIHNMHIDQRSLDLVSGRFHQGITNELDVALSERELATIQSTIAPLQAAISQAQRRVAVLLGRMPQSLYAELAKPSHVPDLPETIAPGLPIELIRRRPDIREAERRLAASNARLGVAVADLFPRVSLSGAFGFQGQGLGQTPVQQKMIWSLGPAVYLPLLDFGTLDSIVQYQDLRTQELLYNYRQTILLAVEEVDNAISNYTAQRDRLDRLNEAVKASERAVTLATQRYQQGIANYLDVVDAQRQLYDLQDQQAAAEEFVVLEYIALYKALGGGWENYQQIPTIRRPQPAVIAAGREAVAPTKQPGQ